MDKNSLLVITGEHSGDLHAAAVVREILALRPGLRISASGGRELASAGAHILEDIGNLSVIGLSDILPNIRTYIDFYRRIREILRHPDKRPAGVILVDFAGFNLRVAALAAKYGVPVIYLIPPKVWAWNRKRISKIRDTVTKIICIFDFEEKLFRNAGVDAVFTGNPNYDRVAAFSREHTPGRLREELGVHRDFFIGILPGSRKKEVQRILPDCIRAADRFSRARGNCRIAVSCAPSLDPALIESELRKEKCDAPVITGSSLEMMAEADFLIVKSGTSTLEAGLIGTPMAVVYKTSALTYRIARWLVRSSFISLPNIILNKKAVPELIQNACNPEHLQITLQERTTSHSLDNVRSQLRELHGHMGKEGFAARSAAEILSGLGL